MRGRRPKPTRLKMLTGNPGKRPLTRTSRGPKPLSPIVLLELGPVAQREWDRLVGELHALTHADQPRSRRACRLLRRLRALGGGDRGDPEVRHHGEVAVRLSRSSRPTSRSPTARPRS